MIEFLEVDLIVRLNVGRGFFFFLNKERNILSDSGRHTIINIKQG